jgi:hypothetical protein
MLCLFKEVHIVHHMSQYNIRYVQGFIPCTPCETDCSILTNKMCAGFYFQIIPPRKKDDNSVSSNEISERVACFSTRRKTSAIIVYTVYSYMHRYVLYVKYTSHIVMDNNREKYTNEYDM